MTETREAYVPKQYWNRLVTGDGSLANVGQDLLGKYNDFAYRFRLRALCRLLEGIDLKSSSVFEAAFGEGFYLRFWNAAGARAVAGMDISQDATRAARTLFPGFDLRAGDLTDSANFSTLGTFDLVTAIDVLYHIVDDTLWSRAIANLLPRVAPGGAFVFSDKVPLNGTWQKFPHVRRRSVAMWEEQLSAGGFEIVRRLPVFVFMDDPITCGHHKLLGHLSMLQWRIGTRLIRMCASSRGLQNAVASLYAISQWVPEWLLVNTLKRTPNLELFLCRRKDAGKS